MEEIGRRSCKGVFAQEDKEEEEAGRASGSTEEFGAIRVMFILQKPGSGSGTDFLGKAQEATEDALAFQGCMCFVWRHSPGSCSLLLCHSLPLDCVS